VRNHRLRLSTAALLTLALLTAAAGCEREDPIRTYDAPQDVPMPQLTGGPGITWKIPQTWKPLRVQDRMTYAAFVVEDGLRPLTVSPLPAAGSATLPNVNRWEAQLGLPQPSAEADLAKVVTPIKVDGQDAQWVDLAGPDPAPGGGPQERILAAIVPGRDTFWFFKLQGPADKVERQKSAMSAFLQTIKLTQGANVAQPPAPQMPLDHPPVQNNTPPAAAADQEGKIPGVSSMKLPDGWKIDPNPRPMRSATIIVPGKDAGPPAEIVVSRLGGNFGGLQANINRWRGQVGLPPAENENAHKPEQLTLEQGPALVYDFQGPEAAGKDRKRQFVFQTNFPNAQQTWFFRLIGPHETVTAAKPAFDSFVKSLKFGQ
jgi:hypothetical protein